MKKPTFGYILIIFWLCLQMTLSANAGSPKLTAEYISGKRSVVIKWQNTNSGVSAYILQRSDDNNTWKDIYTVAYSKFNKKKQEKFSDQNPQPTKNYYRLKISLDGGDIEYSPAIVVIIGNTLKSWIMYPVPVRDVLNLQYNGSDPISGVISIFIQNIHGYILLRNRFSSLNRTIQLPVNNLGKGIYDIRIVINNETVWNQRFVK